MSRLDDQRRTTTDSGHERAASAASPAPVVDVDVDAIPDGMLAFDRAFRYTAWNAAMERLTALPASQVIGRNAFELFPFLVDTGEDRYFHEALAGNSATSVERPFTV